MKKSSYTATHSGECQLCGHIQKLPGGGRLSLHGYTKQWGFFSGVCSGARGWPYETHTDLLAGEVKRQQSEIKRLTEWTQTITENKGKTLWVSEYVSAQGRMPSRYEWRELTPADYSVKVTKYDTWSSEKVEWMTTDRTNYLGAVKGKPKLEQLNVDGSTAVEQIASANARKVKEISGFIKQREEYVVWLKARIKNWKLRPLTALAPEEIGSKQTTVHAIGAYWSKREGRDIALCVSSIRAAGYKATTKDNAKVTCKACLKTLAAQDADAAIKVKRDALIAEMVAKFGPSVLTQFSDANGQAIKEIRYQRKEIDKDVRKAATDHLERGVRS